MKVLITICARGGSKGIPGKNIKPLNGKPLIFYTLKTARQFQQKFEYVTLALSTDSDEIKKVAEDYGLKTDYRRPDYLAGDEVGKIDAINDVLMWQEEMNHVRYDYILDMDVTSPLRNLQDLTDAFDLIRKNETAIDLFSVSPARRNPYFNMVERQENGFYGLVKKPEGTVITRQNSPEVYDLNASFYFYKRSFFDLGYKSVVTDKSIVYVVPHHCFDLDDPLDFEIISFLIENNKLDFVL